MTKYGRWEAISSSSGSDSDSGNDEQLQGTKKEIEDNVKKILKLIKSNENNGIEWSSEETLKKQSELVELVEGFHRQYKSLYALYDHLKEELKEKIDNTKEKQVSSSYASSSDSEYFSPEEVSSKNSKWSEPHKVAESVKQKLEHASLAATDLKRKLIFTTENEGLHLEYKEALSKNQELKRMISDLEIEAEQRQNIIQAVKDESAQLKEELGEREKHILSSAQMHKVRESEVSAWKKELEGQIAALRLEQNSLCTQKREMEQRVESKTIEIKQLGEENSKLQAQVLELEKISEGKGKEHSVVVKKLKDHEKNSNSKINDLVAQVNSLQVEVDSLRMQKGKLEEELESKRNEASAQVKGLMEQADKERLLKDGQIDKLQDTIFELEKKLKERGEESYALHKKFKNGDDEASARFMSLTAQFNKLKKEFDSLQTEKQQSLESLIQVKTQNSELTSTIAEQQRTLKEQEYTINHSKSKLQTSERKMAEMAEEFCKKVEDNVRLLCQRIQVAEALHAENKENYRVTKDKFEQEHKMLLLRDENLKSSAGTEVEEKSSLMNAVSQLETKMTGLEKLVKEKEEGMQELGEEKREAIRQLCMLIDYHRCRYDHLKELISKSTARGRRAP